jgi:GST-like protein
VFLADAERQENHDSAREAGIAFNIKAINIGRGDQLSPHFLKISSNGQMSAIIDHEP